MNLEGSTADALDGIVGRPRAQPGGGSRALQGAGVDLRSLSVDPDTRFPGESGEYRRERNRLLEGEIELRRAIERVAAQRRALPPGGPVPDDYRFEEVSNSGPEVRFSELFEAGKDMLVVYSFMFPRWSGDTRAGPANGETARLPLAETRARPAHRSSTRSTAPLPTSPSGSTLP